ncbi:MAG: hypothetical protein FJZ15_04110 [Candidatus Omnitrophica bacterium]|nr:hypothetical protein [Candidatus Omnitrophota bacterium]
MVEKPVEFKPDIIAEAKPEILIEGETTGAILLKAADFIIGGITRFNEVIRTRMHIPSLGVLNRTGGLIYSKLTSGQNLWPLINQRVTDEELSSYLIELQQVTILNSDLLQAMPMLFKDARGIKISLSTNALLYLDSQFYTIWSTPHIPYSFSASIDRIRTYINKYLLGNGPFILMMAPGYDIPTSEFFDFVLGLDAPDKEPITAVSFYGNNLQDIESTKIESIKKRNIIFGLWPSQFIQYRKVNKIKEFKPFLFTPLNKEFYIAEIELELSQPNTHKTLTFRGCALKLSPTEKTRLVILSNFPSENLNLEELCSTYLSHWPNLEEAFQDYSRKVELFTYAAASEHQFSTAITGIMGEPAQDISLFFDNYLKVLDLFVKWNFLPAGYENKDFPTIKAQFYDLPVSIRPEKSHYSVLFKIPSQYTYANDLKYACRRLNEKEITAPDGKRYWFSC